MAAFNKYPDIRYIYIATLMHCLFAEGSCLYHSGKLKEAGTHAYYTCCADRKVTLGMFSEVPGCTQGRHQDHHHTDYPYNAYTEFMNQQVCHDFAFMSLLHNLNTQ